MIIKCDACGNQLEVEDSLPSGTHLICPSCGEELILARPSRIELPTNLERHRNTARGINAAEPSVDAAAKSRLHIRRTPALQSATNVCARQIMERMQNKEAKESEVRARVKPKRWNVVISISLFAVIVFGVLAIHWWKSQHDLVAQDENRYEVSAEDSERARRQREDDAERERKRREADAERARRKAEADAERERRRLAREKELQEQKEKAEAEKENRERIENVERKFRSAPMVFASDFSTDESPFKKDGTFYAIGLEYISDQKIYEAMVEQGVVVAARAFSAREEPIDVEVKTFTDNIMKSRLLVLGEDGVVWICGTGKSFWTEEASIAKGDITPSKKELGELYAILSKWDRLPTLRYRLTLKSSKNGSPVKCVKEIPLGIIKYAETISSDSIRDAVLKPLQEKREMSANIKPPKLKKFKPTVVLYDGDITRKEMTVTKVPRTFKHHGASTSKYNYALEQWQRLKREAELQQQKQDEVVRENARRMQEYNDKVRAILSKGITGEEIEAEVQKYVLLIERSRSRVKVAE